ncbi:MAG: hypothetical protein U5R49_07445 [Deltaproteobacteria bacterium]|nr:hypothetical protein [Deltaproteobacteria bacterium]
MEQMKYTHTEQKIIERLKRLPPQQLDEVIQFIDFIVERGEEKMTTYEIDDVKRSILDLRGRGKGEHLVERLLRSRREDKKLEERN